MNISINNNQKIILYNILKNVLNITLFAWLGALLVEILIPGFISSYLSFSKIILIVAILILAIYYLSKDFELETKNKNSVSKADTFIGFLSVILAVGVASINFPLPIVIILTIITLITILYFYKNIN